MRRLAVFLFLILPLTASAAEGEYSVNLRTAPILWVVAPNLRADFKTRESWSVGLGALALDRKIKAVKMRGTTAAVYVTYAFDSALNDTWFLDAGGFYGDVRAEAKSASGQIHSRLLHNSGARLTGGYQWFWGHFNLTLAAGGEWNSEGDRYVRDDAGNNLEKIPLRRWGVVLEGLLGLAF